MPKYSFIIHAREELSPNVTQEMVGKTVSSLLNRFTIVIDGANKLMPKFDVEMIPTPNLDIDLDEPQSQSQRIVVMAALKGLLGERWFLKKSEEFDPSNKGGIWTTNETYSKVLDDDCIMSQHTMDIHPLAKKLLDRHGWYVEPYDSGTLMIYPK